MAVVFLLEVVSAILAFVLMDRLQTHLKDYMYEAIVNYQDEPSLKDTMDYLQKRVSFDMYPRVRLLSYYQLCHYTRPRLHI